MIASRSVVGLVALLSTAGAAGGAGLLLSAPDGTRPADFHDAPEATQAAQDPNAPYDGQYHFARVRFSPGGQGGFGGFGRRRGGRGGAMWAHDYPRADYNFLAILRETTFVRTHRTASNVVAFDDPDIFRHPVSYIVEVGSWNPTDEEASW